jgi:hypothetical protein
VLAGAVAAWLVVRSRPRARFDETSLVGGLAGLTGGLLFVGLAWATSGNLGTVRLVGLGPLLLPLLVMAVTTLGLSGMVTGLGLGLWRRRRSERGPDPQPGPTQGRSRRAGATALPTGPDGSEPTEILARDATSRPPEESR